MLGEIWPEAMWYQWDKTSQRASPSPGCRGSRCTTQHPSSLASNSNANPRGPDAFFWLCRCCVHVVEAKHPRALKFFQKLKSNSCFSINKPLTYKALRVCPEEWSAGLADRGSGFVWEASNKSWWWASFKGHPLEATVSDWGCSYQLYGLESKRPGFKQLLRHLKGKWRKRMITQCGGNGLKPWGQDAALFRV